MIRWVQTRLVIEKPVTHEKYYPTVISATTQKSYPFSISYADIEVASNVIGSTSSYISQFRFDNIVRLQVSIKTNPNQKTVWKDIFEGRIVNLDCEYGQNNNVKIYCYGHEASAETDMIPDTYSYPTTTDAKAVLQHYSLYLTRLTYTDILTATGVSFPSYDTKAFQTYMSDFFADMEKVSGYTYQIKVIPTYTSAGNLGTIMLSWNRLDQTVNDQYKVMEGTYRLLKAQFSVEGKGIRTYYKVYGDTPDGGSQYVGHAEDHDLSDLYGRRCEIETQTWVQSSALCTSIAEGLLAVVKNPEVSGQVELLGTPEASVGNLVYCKLPSMDLNGGSIDGNFTVYRVQHDIKYNDFKTTLDLGKIKKTAYDYVNKVAKSVSTCKKNQVK